MRDGIYTVQICLDEDGEIKDAMCTCPRGQHLCHHMAAVCIYGHHNISVTDVDCRWAVRKPKDDEVKTIDEIYVAKTHRSTSRDLTDEEINEFQTKLQQFGTTVGFAWLLRPEPVPQAFHLVDVEEFLFSEPYFSSTNKTDFFLNSLKVTPEAIKVTCQSTIGQSKNDTWLICRKNRLTASNFGVVLSAVRRGRYPPSLFKRLTNYYNLENVRAIQWGTINESKALEEFVIQKKLQVVTTGLWLHPCGFLGASPDGLIGEDSLIEIKCPYKYREKSILQELQTDHSYIIYLQEDDIIINKKHEYYDQIQGNLIVTGRKLCYLFIWTPIENILIEIAKDEEWVKNIDFLKQFYIEKYVLYLIENVTV